MKGYGERGSLENITKRRTGSDRYYFLERKWCYIRTNNRGVGVRLHFSAAKETHQK